MAIKMTRPSYPILSNLTVNVYLTLLAEFSVGEAQKTGSLLLIAAAIVGEGIVDSGGLGLLGAAGLVQVGSSGSAPLAAGEKARPRVEHLHDGAEKVAHSVVEAAENVSKELCLCAVSGEKKHGDGRENERDGDPHLSKSRSQRGLNCGLFFRVFVRERWRCSLGS